MKLPFRGQSIIALSIIAGVSLGGCAAPIAEHEAQGIAEARMMKFCAGNCGTLHFTHAQKIKDRWLIDFDAPAHKFTVIVENDGNTQVSIWDKSRDTSGQ